MTIDYYIPTKLNKLVKIIWEQRSENSMKWQILPSGQVELIFIMGPKMENVKGKLIGNEFNPTKNFCFLSGLHTKPLHMSFPSCHVMGVQMEPVAVKAIFGIPCLEVKDWAVPGEIILKDINKIEDNLCGPGEFIEKAKWLENYLLNKINETNELSTAIKMNTTLNKMYTKLELGNKLKIEDFTGYSRMHSHRLFTEWLGLPPSQCLRLHKFVKVLNNIHKSSKSLTEVGLENGFYDQAHFIHNFREFSDMTPGQYKKRKSTIVGQLFS